jgi:high-affinity nickel-transport protein
VFVALAIGTIEYLQVTSTLLHLNGGLFGWLDRLDFETLGYGIVAVFLVAWVGSVALFRIRRVEERWGGMVRDDPVDRGSERG